MFLDHILAIGGPSLHATQNLYLCAAWRGPGGRGGYSRSYFIWCQHFSFYPGVWFDDTTRMNLTFSHRSGIYHPSLSLATPGPSWRLHPSQYYKLASPSPASHSALWLLAQINLMMSLKIEETLCWSFAVLTSISLWDLDIEHSFTELQKLRSLHIEY